MKIITLTKPKSMAVIKIDKPEIKKPTDVLIKMKSVGVCGSDMHYYRTGRIGDQIVKFPFTVGHEGAGQVEAVGEQVTRVQPGDRIAIDPAMPCFTCDQCKAGRAHTCRNLTFLGNPGQAEGCLTEYIVMPETSCFKIPDTMTIEEAVISEPFAIGLYTAKRGRLKPGYHVGILGMGPIGQCVMIAARHFKIQTIYGSEKIEDRVRFSESQGISWCGNPDKEDIVKTMLDKSPLGLDMVFDCCGEQQAMDQAIQLLKPGGRLVIVGIPEVDRISFDIANVRRKEIDIINIRRQNECTQEALNLITSGQVSVAHLTTHNFPFDQAKAAFDLVADYRDGVMKAIISMDKS